jgi:hypothetical protein
MSTDQKDAKDRTIYETIWRDLVDIYDFVEDSEIDTETVSEEMLEEVNS